MKIALCEDEQEYVTQFLEVLDSLSLPDSIEMSIFETGESLLFALAETRFDGLFLDIKLAGGMDGMALAKEIRKNDAQLPIVFLSNYDDYVFDGYDVGALSYVLKPVTQEKLAKSLSKIIDQRDVPMLVLKISQELRKIPQFDILYVEAEGHQLKIVTQKEEILYSAKLADVLEELTDSFYQIHRSYIVNLSHIVRVKGSEAEMSNGERLPVARNRKKELKETILCHYRGLSRDD